MIYNPIFNALFTPLSFEVDLFLPPRLLLSSTTGWFRYVKQLAMQYSQVLALTLWSL